MNTGQTMLTIAALTLLSIITLRYFASVGQSGQTLADSNSGLTATTIATSYIERAQGAQFDELSDGVPLDSMQKFYNTILTAPGVSLTAETASERLSPDNANDFDDFNYFNTSNPFIVVPEGIPEIYKVEFNVYYVDTNNINVNAGHRTFLKRMDLKVYRIDTGVVVNMSTVSAFFRP